MEWHHFGTTLASLWCDSAVTLDSLLACDGGFGSLGSHFVAYGGHAGTIYGDLRVIVRGHLDTLGWLWHHFGVTLGIWRYPWITLGHFGVTLGVL